MLPHLTLESPVSHPVNSELLDQLPLGLCVFDADLRVLAWNKTLEGWTGIARDELLHSNLGLRFPKLRQPGYFHRLEEALHHGVPVLFSAGLHRHVLDIPGRNGSAGEFMVQETWVRRLSGSPPLLLMSVQDLTTEYRQLSELRNDRRELVCFQQQLEQANHSLQASLVMYARNNQRLQAEVQERAHAEEELRKHASDLAAAKDREAEHAGWLEHLVKELTAARQQAEAAAQTKSEFLANMSHEIRTPMTAILGYVDILREPGISEEEKRDAIETVQRNGQHLLAIINDILDISKIESGRMTIERLSISPRQLIDDIVGLMSPRATEKNLDFKSDFMGEIPLSIQTDPTRLRQILVNLIGNALKFTASGSVRVVTQLVPAAGQSRLRVDVIDSGIGMNDQQLRNLFQPFTQADMTMTRQYGGTGLGLAISQRLARMLGGEITISSELGRGSCFTVTIDPGEITRAAPSPAPTTVTLSTPKPTPAASQPLSSVRVLIVDDAPDNRRLLSFHINKAGGTFDTAENGEIAVQKIRAARESQPFDVILMDMQMPVLDGYAATGVLRREGIQTPILALTAHAMVGDREKCLSAGCDDFLTKPIDRTQLLNTIIKYTTARKPDLTVFSY